MNVRLLVCLLFAATAAKGQISAELLSLMGETQRVAAGKDLSQITGLASKNPGFVSEITLAALQAQPSNRAAVIAAMIGAMPNHAGDIAAAAAKGAPAGFAAELAQIVAGRSPAEVVSIAARAATAEPKLATTIAQTAAAAAPASAPAVAAVVAKAAPQQSGEVAIAAMNGGKAFAGTALGVGSAVGAIASAVVGALPAQAGAVTKSTLSVLLKITGEIQSYAPTNIMNYFGQTMIAVAVTAIVQSAPGAMRSILNEVVTATVPTGVGFANGDLLSYSAALIATAMPEVKSTVISTVQTFRSGNGVERAVQNITNEAWMTSDREFRPSAEYVAAVQSAASSAKASPSTIAPPAPVPAAGNTDSSGGRSSSSPATNPPPLTPPVDPTANVSRSS